MFSRNKLSLYDCPKIDLNKVLPLFSATRITLGFTRFEAKCSNLTIFPDWIFFYVQSTY